MNQPLERTPWSEQRARIYPMRAEILRRLDDGQSILAIRAALGLEDIPASTFYWNVATLRKQRSGQDASSSVEPAKSETVAAGAPEPKDGSRTRGKTRRGPIIPASVELPKGRDAGKDRPEPLKPEDYM